MSQESEATLQLTGRQTATLDVVVDLFKESREGNSEALCPAKIPYGKYSLPESYLELRICAFQAARDIQPYISVIDRCHQTRGRFTCDVFRYNPEENAYYCPEGKPLHYRGQRRSSHGYLYRSTEAQCPGCPQKTLCTRGPYRRLFVHWEEPVRQIIRGLADTPAYKSSQRARYKIEALFAELKQQIGLRSVRLRRLWNVAEQFHLAATAQNLKRLVRFLALQHSMPEPGAA